MPTQPPPKEKEKIPAHNDATTFGITRAPFSENCPLEIQDSVTFSEQDGQTTVTLHAKPFGEADAERQYFEALHPSLEQGYGGTFDQLTEYLRRA
ncbi:MAG TPA: hypothetical protein VEN30_07705 [Paraburkholderia sp.]|nr:hypothetical protein [Paraburkholderia sp.]